MSLAGNYTKPSAVSNSIAPTDTIVTQQQQGITDAQASTSTRAQNLFGITITRGGQTLGIGFLDAIIAAYSNLSLQPVAVVLAFISFIYYLNKLLQTGEAGNIYNVMGRNVWLAGNSSDVAALRSTSWFLAALLSFIENYGDFFTMAFAMWFPYFAKPSKRNGIISSGVTFMFIFMLREYITILTFSHAYFLYTQLRSPAHKGLIVLFAVVVCVMGHHMVHNLTGMEKLGAKYSGTTPPPPAVTYGTNQAPNVPPPLPSATSTTPSSRNRT